jgi:hypothetical protein
MAAGAVFDPTKLWAAGSFFWGLYRSARAVEEGLSRKRAESAALSFFTAVQKTERTTENLIA